jgi:hypothetical protein
MFDGILSCHSQTKHTATRREISFERATFLYMNKAQIKENFSWRPGELQAQY